MEEKTYPNRFPMKHGCYRFTSVDNGFHIESVKYDSTKEYGNFREIQYICEKIIFELISKIHLTTFYSILYGY